MGEAEREIAPEKARETARTTRRRWPRRFAWIASIALVVAGSVLAAPYVFPAEPSAEEDRPLVTVERGTIVDRALVVGRIVPRTEVQVRSTLPGILVELRVRPGDVVEAGQHVATVSPVADPVALSDARARVELARLRRDAAARDLERRDRPRDRQGELLVPREELDRARDALAAAEAERVAAERSARLLAEGSTQARGQASTRVLAPIGGTVLSVPAVVGSFVSETNPYRDGTTVAVVANMSDLVFKGQIDEARVAELSVGTRVTVDVGARREEPMVAPIEHIAPQATIRYAGGVTVVPTPGRAELPGGVTTFELWVTVPRERAPSLRAGYSATAEIVFGRRENVLVVDEGAVHVEGARAHVLVARPDRALEERFVELGVSDGIRIEVVSGLDLGERVALRMAR